MVSVVWYNGGSSGSRNMIMAPSSLLLTIPRCQKNKYTPWLLCILPKRTNTNNLFSIVRQSHRTLYSVPPSEVSVIVDQA